MGKGMMLLRLGAILMLLVVLGFWVTSHAQTPALQNESSSAGQQQQSNLAERQNQQAQTSQKQKDQSAEETKNEEEDGAGATKAHTHVHLGTVTFGASYTNFGHAFLGPFYPYPYYPYGAFSVGAFYMPFSGYPFYGPFYYPAYGPVWKYGPGKGEVKLSSLGRNKNAEVYIDNAYAGIAGKLKEMWLDPGVYDLSLKAADGSSFTKRIYVLSGKSLKITPDFQMSAKTPAAEDKK
jgi:hypothetical protein